MTGTPSPASAQQDLLAPQAPTSTGPFRITQPQIAPGARLVGSEADPRLPDVPLYDPQVLIRLRKWASTDMPRPDLLASVLGSDSGPPFGDWIDRERRVFTAALGKSHPAILVAPVLDQELGLDRTQRALIGAEVAGFINATLPNSEFVNRAFGEGRRAIPLDELVQMAIELNTPELLVIHAGHNGRQELIVTAAVYRPDGSSPSWKEVAHKTWGAIPFTDETPPAQALRSTIPEIVKLTGLGLRSHRSDPRDTDEKSFLLPLHTPNRDLRGGSNAIAEIVQLEWQGTLVPRQMERYTDRIFVEALARLDQLSTTAPQARLLRARAWYYLHSRPAALAALGKASKPEEKAFLALLNGNFPEAEEATGKSTLEAFRAMQELELQSLRNAYAVTNRSTPSDFLKTLMASHPDWSEPIARRFGDGDPLTSYPAYSLKLLLDRDFPVAGFDADSVAKGILITSGKPTAPEAAAKIAEATLEHIDRVRQNEPVLATCNALGQHCLQASELDLLEAESVDASLKSVEYLSDVQGLPDAARSEMARLSPSLRDLPQYLGEELQLDMAELRHAPGQNQRTLMDRLNGNARRLALLEQGQSRLARLALLMMGVPSPNSSSFLVAYGKDFPVRPEWFQFGTKSTEYLQNAIKYATDDIDPVIQAFQSHPAVPIPGEPLPTLAELVAQRFIGSPRALQFAAASSPDDAQAQVAAYETQIKTRPDLWAPYSQLGQFYLRSTGDVAKAANTFSRFPGFAKPEDYNPVALANWAFEAGSALDTRGHVEEALKYYGISAGLDTGSLASITAAARLDMAHGDFEQASAHYLEAARRYNDSFDYSDYLALQFAFGNDSNAWAGFNRLHNQFRQPDVWRAAWVGQRRAGTNWTDLRKWLLSEPIRSSSSGGQPFGLGYAITLNSVDREPASDLIEVLGQIEGSPRAQYDGCRSVNLPAPGGSQGLTVRTKSGLEDSERTCNPMEEAAIHLPQFYFAQAYIPLRKGNFHEAVDRFYEMDKFYPMLPALPFNDIAYPLPYFAWASAKIGDPKKVENVLNKIPEIQLTFDQALALAYLRGGRGDVDGSVTMLRRASNLRRPTGFRPIPTEYQWTEACLWLYTDSQDRRYADLALEWLRALRQAIPEFAWVHAATAKFTQDEAERIRELGYVMYLDPNSSIARSFPPSVLEKARASFDADNPFRQNGKKPDVQRTEDEKEILQSQSWSQPVPEEAGS